MRKIPIQPKEIVNLSRLEQYDRFVPITNKKIVWQVIDHIFVTDFKNEKKKMTRCIDDNLNTKRFDSNRTVIFLRNNNPNSTKRTRLNKNPELIDY